VEDPLRGHDTEFAANVIEFPRFQGRIEWFSKLDGFVMTDLAPVIGFQRGAYALHNAGYRFIGDLVASSPQAIGGIPGIGPKKLAKICDYILSLGLWFGEDTTEWREYHSRFADHEPASPDEPIKARRHGHPYLTVV
jgi:hypothetical protein